MNYKTKNTDSGKELAFFGSFTFRDHSTFFEIISMIKTTANIKIVFDLAKCDFIDSAALGMFVIAHDEAMPRSIDLVIKGANGKVKEVMNAAKFQSLYRFEL